MEFGVEELKTLYKKVNKQVFEAFLYYSKTEKKLNHFTRLTVITLLNYLQKKLSTLFFQSFEMIVIGVIYLSSYFLQSVFISF